MTPESLVRTVEEFLAASREAVVVEDGAVLFDLGEAKYSVSGEYNKCLVHFWSTERNAVRRVVDAETKNDVLRLAVQRLGQSRPSKLEICRQRDRRTPSAKRAARMAYRRTLERTLHRHFPEFHLESSQLQWIWNDRLAQFTRVAWFGKGNPRSLFSG